MRVAFYDYCGNGRRFGEALIAAGHELVDERGDVALADHDACPLVPAHAASALYPHGGNPMYVWDAMPPHPNVRLAMVHGRGHAEVLAAFGFDRRVEEVGWSFSDLAPRRYPDRVRRVLMAPDHALQNGYDPVDYGLEAEVLRAVRAQGWEVVERRWRPGGNLTHDDLDAADLAVVKAESTVGYLAAARGTPMIAYGGDADPDCGVTGPVFPPRWRKYRHMVRYPIDFADAPLADLADAAIRPSDGVDDWTDRFVGGPFRPARVVEHIEGLAP